MGGKKWLLSKPARQWNCNLATCTDSVHIPKHIPATRLSHAFLPLNSLFFPNPDQRGEPATTAQESGGHSSDVLPFSTVKQEGASCRPPLLVGSSLLSGSILPCTSMNKSASFSFSASGCKELSIGPPVCVEREQTSCRKRCHGVWTA